MVAEEGQCKVTAKEGKDFCAEEPRCEVEREGDRIDIHDQYKIDPSLDGLALYCSAGSLVCAS